ncbi:DUF624 domain-containing protein [Microbacterium hominis]|uniref:DUF624 domain-containing protein n=1 Tax=Microbacterium hominis TaxID=162426 RepID=A0A7D4UJ13_9MICO|nr:DUF624 domain-containing protein [Microbacterium hominis]QKJ20588.1 DUF624 domain-containing protein [Microbacterium hominis]
MDRREARAARRAERDGSGPTLEEREPTRYPGATGAFALFGEALYTGLLITIASLPIVTMPAALTAGIRHLRRYLNAEQSHARQFWRDYRTALPGGIAVGAVTAVIAAVLTADILLAGTGALPGGTVIGAVGWVGLVAAGVALLAITGGYEPARGWMPAVRGIPSIIRADFVGALYLAATVVFVGVATWMLIPLLLPALGLAALAVVAIPTRRRGR